MKNLVGDNLGRDRERAKTGARIGIPAAALLVVALLLTSLLFAGRAQAAASFQSSSVIGPSTGLSLLAPVPSGTSLNDMLIAQVSGAGGNPTITAPSGWTLINKYNTSTATYAWEAVYWKRATASESAYSWTFNASGAYAVTTLRYSGVTMAASPVNSSSYSRSNSGVITWPTLTPTVSGDVLVALVTTGTSG